MFRLLTNRRVLLGGLVVGILVALVMWPQPIAVDTAVAVREPLIETIDEEGETRVRARFVLAAPVSGEVPRIDLEPGDPVARGDVVATVRAAPPVPLDARTGAENEAARDAARAALGRATAERDRLATMRDRVRQQAARTASLAAAGAVAADELEAVEAEVRASEEALQAAEFVVSQARYEVAAIEARLAPPPASAAGREYPIRSPVDGVVLRRHRESQAVVPAGEPLLDVGDLDALEIVADLLSADAVAVGPGSEVLIERWGGDRTLGGVVRRVEPAGFTRVSALGVEEQRVNVVIDFEATDEERARLGDGYRVDVRIVTWRGDDVLTVPPGGLFRQADAWAVFVVDGDRVRVQQVEVGHRSDTAVEIVAGLEAGDRIVVFPPDTLTDGARVERRGGAG